MCYNSVPWRISFPHLLFMCYITLSRILYLWLLSLPSDPRTTHVHCMCTLSPMPFPCYYQTRNIFHSFFIMDHYSYSQFSCLGYVILITHHSSSHFNDLLSSYSVFLLSHSLIFSLITQQVFYKVYKTLLLVITPHSWSAQSSVVLLLYLESLASRPN